MLWVLLVVLLLAGEVGSLATVRGPTFSSCSEKQVSRGEQGRNHGIKRDQYSGGAFRKHFNNVISWLQAGGWCCVCSNQITVSPV